MKTTKDLFDIDPLQFATMSYIEVIDLKEEAASAMYNAAVTELFGLGFSGKNAIRSAELDLIIGKSGKAADYMKLWREEVGLTAPLKDLSKLALKVCIKAHEGQFRRDGITPYHSHPIAVASTMSDPIRYITALLHDVVEDTYMTLNDIERTFGKLIAKYVGTLSKEKGDIYAEYIKEISQCSVCTDVKIADIKHNSSSNPTQKAILKYASALEILIQNK